MAVAHLRLELTTATLAALTEVNCTSLEQELLYQKIALAQTYRLLMSSFRELSLSRREELLDDPEIEWK